MPIVSTPPLSRRGILASLLSTAILGPVSAFAQSVTDREKTDLLRNGLTPHSQAPDYGDDPGPRPGPRPGPPSDYRPHGPPPDLGPPGPPPDFETSGPPPDFRPSRPPPDYSGDPPPSRIAADVPLIVRRGDDVFHVLIDPYASAEFNIPFTWDSAELTPWSRRQLATLGELLQTDLKQYRYVVAGHTDATGGFQYNLALSMRRALSVRECLIQTYGVEPVRLYVAGLGSTALRDPSRPFWGGNRRVEIVLVKKILDR